MNEISSEIKDLISNPISSTTQGTSTIENLLELITKDLYEITANPINNTITSSTDEISESIFSDNTESWTETGINLINNTVANLTNTAFNTTYNSQENMFDESDNDNSLVVAQYISIGTAVVASIAVIIGVGVT